jgi:type II secretory pathway component PulF
MSIPPMIDYEFSASPRRRRGVFSTASFVTTSAAMLLVLTIFLFVIPQFEKAVLEAGAELPAFTMAMFKISGLLRTTGGWVFGVLIALSLGAFVAVLPIRGKALRLMLTLVMGLIVAAFALAIFMPMMQMVQSISP